MKNILLLLTASLLVAGVQGYCYWTGNNCYDDTYWDSCITNCTEYSWGVECTDDSSGHYPVYLHNWCGWYKYLWAMCNYRCANCSGSSSSSCSRCNPGYYLGIFSGQTTTCYDFGSCPTGSVSISPNIVCTACDPPCYQCSGTTSNCSSCKTNYYRNYWGNQCYSTQNYCPSGDSAVQGQVIVVGNGICQPCDPMCATCTIPNNAAYCTMCLNGYYLWQQSQHTCSTACRNGSDALGLHGQFEGGSNQCVECNSLCRSCNGTSTNCFTCMAGSYLVDDYATCRARWIDSGNCTIACTAACQGDNFCMSTMCPNDYYFEVPQSTVTTLLGYKYPAGSDRRNTSLCELCDARCRQCTGPSNLNCTACTDYYFKWTNATYCTTDCPGGQYKGLQNTSLTAIQRVTQCRFCDYNCLLCSVKSSNCSQCVYPYTHANASYLYKTSQTDSICIPSCPTSANPLTDIGYYGSVKIMTCLACPSPCSNCNINIYLSNPAIDCTDTSCSNVLLCTSCLNGYTLVQGHCLSNSQCRVYAKYVPVPGSTQWASSGCTCLSGYYISSYVTCSLCDFTCQTCRGAAANECTTCPNDYTMTFQNSTNVSGTCVLSTSTTTLASYAGTSAPTGAFSTPSKTYRNICSSNYLFGFNNTAADSTNYLQFSTTSLGTIANHWAINFRFKIIFIDEWPGSAAVSIKDPAGITYYSWVYNVYGAIGQQLCGDNRYDYVIPFFASWNHTATGTSTYRIRTNDDLIGTNYQWGIREVVVSISKCHSNCVTCTGPLSTDCSSCSTTNMVSVNGTCVCDSANGWYWQSTACVKPCQTSPQLYGDPTTHTCVPSTSCSFPNLFGSPTGLCVQYCPNISGTAYYAYSGSMLCVADCYTTYGQYKFNGVNNSCYAVCPNNYVAALTGQCLTKCPSGSYRLIENNATNPKCSLTCTTGYKFDGDNTCVSICPVGYFISSGVCVKTCPVGTYGDVVNNSGTLNGSCVTNCSNNYYADSTSHLCLKNCPSGTYEQQNSNFKSCVSGCVSGQYGDPLAFVCLTDPMRCPNGYYGDTHTNMCVTYCGTSGQVADNSTKTCRTSCTAPGYAYWAIRMCVTVCPTTPNMFGDVTSGRQCVSSCNSATTNLFGDPQQNRTCQPTCNATPVATFGDYATNECTSLCTLTTYGDDLGGRLCRLNCTSPKFSDSVSRLCVTTCPEGYYGDMYSVSGKRVCEISCPANYFGDPTDNLCKSVCSAGLFGDPTTGLCVQQCPNLYFGANATTNRLCVQICDSGYWADNATRLCTNSKYGCTNGTFADATKRLCVAPTNCTTYADPLTNGCEAVCTGATYFADPNTHTCVTLCPDLNNLYSDGRICTALCSGGNFMDYQQSRSCVSSCSRSPLALYSNPNTFYCVLPAGCPTSPAQYFANNNTISCVATCSGTLPYGDPTTLQCVLTCPKAYYGQIQTNMCVQNCSAAYSLYADNTTGLCTTKCTDGTYGVNSTTSPKCEVNCPSGSYARATDNICVANCGAGLYGDIIKRKCVSNPADCSDGYYANSVSHNCQLPASCQTVTTHYYAQNSTKTCVQQCLSPNYGDSSIYVCVPKCNSTSFGQNSSRLCLGNCLSSPVTAYADSQLSLCVAICSAANISTYGDQTNFACVEPKDCPTSPVVTYAMTSTDRLCVATCPTTPVYYFSYSVNKTCVTTCPGIYYGDRSSGVGICESVCPGANRFADNYTKQCTTVCPASQSTFGDPTTKTCVLICPAGRFAQSDANRQCVTVCAAGSWGNSVTRVCVTDPKNQCPSGTWGDNNTHLCTSLCTDSPLMLYGNNGTGLCDTACPSPSFAYQITKVCIDVCPASLVGSGYFGDAWTTPRKCYTTCQTANTYRDVYNSRTCQSTCTFNSTAKTYADPTTMSCQTVCSNYPQVLYADDNTKTCTNTCSSGYYKDAATQSCVTSCTLLNPSSNTCVQKCPPDGSSIMYASNLSPNTCVIAVQCPTNTFGSFDTLECVSNCPSGQYKNSATQTCVSICPSGTYKNLNTLTCVTPSNCPAGYFSDNVTLTCVSACVGSFGDSSTRACVKTCPAGKFADPVTALCASSCTNTSSIVLQANTANGTCESTCTVGLYANPTNNSCDSQCLSPYYADDNTRTCVLNCPSNPETYSDIVSNVRKCVTVCSAGKYQSASTRSCVSSCPSGTYNYTLTQSCVTECPSPYYSNGVLCVSNCSVASKFSDDTTRSCVTSCPTGYFSDPTTAKCVVNCPTAPSYYAFQNSTVRECMLTCPLTYYADDSTRKCVQTCPVSPQMYRDTNTQKCVSVCPLSGSYYGDPTIGSCVTTCSAGLFADNRTRTCTNSCGSYLFKDLLTTPPSCVSLCSLTTYANPLTMTCVSTCDASYFKFSNSTHRDCVLFCPYGYFADSSSSTCVQQCPAANPYADNTTHACVSLCPASTNLFGYLPTGQTQNGQCVKTCPSGYFSLNSTRLCVVRCPNGMFGDSTNNTCVSSCNDGLFADGTASLCSSTCSSPLFANPVSMTCVSSCSSTIFRYADAYNTANRTCSRICRGNLFADNTTQTCVAVCPSTPTSLFGDPYLKKCVSKCYNNTYALSDSNRQCVAMCPSTPTDLYADDVTQSCVLSTGCSNGRFGESVSRKCVDFCPLANATLGRVNTFANPVNQKCTSACTSPYYGNPVGRVCSTNCSAAPSLFAENSTRMCVATCLTGFASAVTQVCIDRCPVGYYADSSSKRCVLVCPDQPNPVFGNDNTSTCVSICPTTPDYYGSNLTRTCVASCPSGTFADVISRQCVQICPSTSPGYYSENSTGKCVTTCLTGYADAITRKCIAVCSHGYYGQGTKCYATCPSISPTVYADDSTNLCVTLCPVGTYGSVNKCVQVCPAGMFGLSSTNTQICTNPCPAGLFGDPSTRTCVPKCPMTPSTFGYQPEKLCYASCPYSTYADMDNNTRLCVAVTQCSASLNLYADSTTYTCVPRCPEVPPMYGNPQTRICVLNCPASYNLFADNVTRLCVNPCPSPTYNNPLSQTCVSLCPNGYYGINQTRMCSTTCPAGEFADHLLRICVSSCSVDPIYYGNRLTSDCVSLCPGTGYGNPLTQECVFDVASASGCPTGYFSDASTKLCVQVCPMKNYTFGDSASKRCVVTCPAGTYADNSTMLCVAVCPTMPNYFAHIPSNICVALCPTGLFADPISRTCVAQCPSGSWSQNATRRCVTQCSRQSLGFADNTTWRCVAVCPAVPSMLFGSLETLQCVPQCLASEKTYSDNTTNKCVKVCPPNSYGQNLTRQCQSACPTGTYADNSNWMCVSRCSDHPPTFSDPVSLKCLSSCPINFTNQLYANEPTRQCLSSCPAINGVRQFRQNSTRTCVYNCLIADNSYAENSTGYCVAFCSAPNYADPSTHTCVSICPDQPLLYGQNTTRTCVAMCPTPTFGDNVTRTCVSACPSNSLSLRQVPQGGVMITKNLCVYYCPDNTFAYYVTTFCFGSCPVPYYGDPSTRSCVLTCPLNQLLYADNVTRTCVKKCPDNSYAYDNTTECLLTCPVEILALDQTYAADYNNKCVKECANPTFAYIPDLRCLNTCPNRYYGNESDHVCYSCPSVCVTCHSPTLCYSCVNLYYLQDGQCVAVCSASRYAKSSIMQCVISNRCQPQFGNNVTRTCDTNCPSGTYGNTSYYRCDPCPATCTSCLNLTYCTGCVTNSLTASNYCFGYCSNSTFKYYLQNGTCVDACPNGTYLNLLNCLPCSSNCTTCTGTAGNCTRCSNGLYLQGLNCVSQCDTGYLPNSSLICVSCGTCVNVLNYTLNTTQVNGKNVVFVTYNNNVTVNGNLSDTMQLVPVSSRRLLGAVSGVSVIQVDNTTFMFILPDGTNISNFQYQILKPENVVDPSGNIPYSSRQSVSIPLTQSYTTDTTDTQGIINFALFLSAVCWFTFLFDTEMLAVLQLLYLHYFVSSTFPLTFSSILSAMKLSTLGWLPNILGAAVPDFVRHDYIPSKIIDLLQDYLFIRNGGYFFTVAAVVFLAWAVIKILSVPQINRFKSVRMWCQQNIENRWKFSLPIQIFNVLYLPAIFYFLLNFREYAHTTDGLSIASAVVSWLAFLLFVGVLAVCLIRVIIFFRQHPKLSANISRATEMILQENEYHLLHSQNMFLFDMKKIDLRDLLYPKINNINVLPFKCIYAFHFLALLCPSVFYLRGLLIAVVLVAAQDSPILQLSLLIVVNVPVALYLIKARPYRFKYRRLRIRNYMSIFNEVVLIGFEIGLLVFALMDRDGAATSTKTLTMLAMSYYLLIVMLVNAVYFAFRIYIEVRRKLWQPFIETECFRLNFPEMAEEYEREKLIKKNKKLAKRLDPKQKQKISALLKTISKERQSNTLRPGQADKQNPDLPQPTKITYFDRDRTSQSSSSTLSRKQRRDMIQKMFDEGSGRAVAGEFDSQWEKLHNDTLGERPEELSDYEEYEEEVEIPKKDLEKYINLRQDQLNLFDMK